MKTAASTLVTYQSEDDNLRGVRTDLILGNKNMLVDTLTYPPCDPLLTCPPSPSFTDLPPPSLPLQLLMKMVLPSSIPRLGKST